MEFINASVLKKSNPITFLEEFGLNIFFNFKNVNVPEPLNTPHSTISPGISFILSYNNALVINLLKILISSLNINPLKLSYKF